MKYLNYVVLFMILVNVVTATADEAAAPLPKTGRVITLVGKNGSVIATFSHDEYAIVPRKPKPKPVAVVPVPAPAVPIVKQDPPKNSSNAVKLYVGVGPGLYETKVVGDSLHISQGYDLVFGVGYSRQLDKIWSVEAVGLSNNTGLLGAGYSF